MSGVLFNDLDIRHFEPGDLEHDAALQFVGALLVEKMSELGWIEAPRRMDRAERAFAERLLATRHDEFTDQETMASVTFVLACLESEGYNVAVTPGNIQKFYNNLRSK